MREIKFRLWNNTTSLYDNNFYIRNGIAYKIGAIEGYINPLLSMSKIDGVLEQYIGIKDRNGIEIYEGDILERENQWDEIERGVVCSKGFTYKAISKLRNTDLLKTFNYKKIGNIHENPEFTEKILQIGD